MALEEVDRIIAEVNGLNGKEELRTISIEEKFEQLKRAGKMILAKRNGTLVKKPQITEVEKKIEWESIYNELRAERF